MAEAEDVITDIARHATIFTQDLWQRHRAGKHKETAPAPTRLEDFSRRIDLLVTGVFGRSYPIRIAQAPAPPTLLTKLFARHEAPRLQHAVPATDGASVWLPAACGESEPSAALDRYRTAALQQAMRAQRGSAACLGEATGRGLQDAYLLMEAHGADQAIAVVLPGMTAALQRARHRALAMRPPLEAFAPHRRGFERLVRCLLQSECGRPPADFPPCATPAESMDAARRLLSRSAPTAREAGSVRHGSLLFRDWWTGELRLPADVAAATVPAAPPDPAQEDHSRVKTARLARTPKARTAVSEEDEERQGAFMIQPEKPHEHAEDSQGMQRPTDRDEATAAEDFAESLSDLPEARLVSTPGRPKEVLLSEDPPGARAVGQGGNADASGAMLNYPEWDYRIGRYHQPGAVVHLLEPALGSRQWVDDTLASHRCLRDTIRRRFEMLRADPVRLRRQLDGDEIDLDAFVAGYADFRAGLPLTQGLYTVQRRARRNMAIMLLIDVSGSTDAWIGGGRRVVDVEREALLLVCLALDSMAEPYSVLAFSGEGPHRVTVASIKRFDEPYGDLVARRIAALEPEHFTRAGAAIRHATAVLMAQPASHRLLLLLSDGKPNDVDMYAGRYGVEDTRQAVAEATLQGVSPFCLTVDRQAGEYLPAIFGTRQFGMLPRPELLPPVLLDWIRRLVSS